MIRQYKDKAVLIIGKNGKVTIHPEKHALNRIGPFAIYAAKIKGSVGKGRPFALIVTII